MKLAILKYNAGNVVSVINALNRLGIDPIWTNDAEEIRSADKVIFPGVGAAGACMDSLRETGLHEVIPTLKQPVLGICVGLQLMCRHSEENDTPCLGIFDAEVRKFEPLLKVPQIGWNTIFNLKTPLFDSLDAQDYVYFVHSYAADFHKNTIATTHYTRDFSAGLHHDNFYAVQFHPEKSGLVGAKILENFIQKI